jgi:ABC-type uncharacterized transport system substrate-binding protein
MILLRPLLLSVALCLPQMAQAHPHIFVDTTLRVLTDDQGRAIGVEVTWAYDELYSLLILEDMELDSDYDGILTGEELARLHKFDMNWDAGFAGDLYATGGAGALALGAPQPVETRFENAKIVTRHIRSFAQPQQGVVLRAYDPTFYTAYDLTGGVHAPEGCTVHRQAADLDAAYDKVAKMMDQNDYADDDYPAVGDAFADTVTVTCADGS